MEGYKQPRLVSCSDGEQIFLRCSAAYNGRELEMASIWAAWLKTPQAAKSTCTGFTDIFIRGT